MSHGLVKINEKGLATERSWVQIPAWDTRWDGIYITLKKRKWVAPKK